MLSICVWTQFSLSQRLKNSIWNFFFFKNKKLVEHIIVLLTWTNYLKYISIFVLLQASNMSAFKMKTEIMQIWNIWFYSNKWNNNRNEIKDDSCAGSIRRCGVFGLMMDCCGAGGLWIELLFGVLRFHTGGVQSLIWMLKGEFSDRLYSVPHYYFVYLYISCFSLNERNSEKK